MESTEPRAYRKSLATCGLLYIGGVEVEIHVKNLSLTGLLAEFPLTEEFKSYKDIFQALLVSPVVDVYLPDIRVAGEAEVVRVEDGQQCAELALEFRDLSYDTDNLLYSRKAYRKNMSAPGTLILAGRRISFTTVNVSVDGLMVSMEGHQPFQSGMTVRFEFTQLDILGDGKVTWVDHNDKITLLGLQYLHLEKGPVKGIPRFDRRRLERRQAARSKP